MEPSLRLNTVQPSENFINPAFCKTSSQTTSFVDLENAGKPSKLVDTEHGIQIDCKIDEESHKTLTLKTSVGQNYCNPDLGVDFHMGSRKYVLYTYNFKAQANVHD